MTKLYKAKGKDPQYWYQKTESNARILSVRNVRPQPKIELRFWVSNG